MKPQNKKICLLFAGGTTLSEKDIPGTSVNQEQDIPNWLEQVPEISLMAEIEPVFICGEEKMLKGAKLWQRVSQLIFQKAGQADGFVVMVKLESVLNLGIALSFALLNLNKTVVLTSSQITPASIKSLEWQGQKKKAYGGLGVKANLINAIQAVNLGLPVTALMFGNRIVSPLKARRIQALSLNLFESFDNKYLGKIDFGISFTDKPKPTETKPELKNKFAEDIQIIDYFPGMDLSKSISSTSGVIIRNLSDLSELKIKNHKLPILVYNPFLFNKEAGAKNVVMVDNLSWETAVIKFMWALANYPEPLKAMGQEYCSEFIH